MSKFKDGSLNQYGQIYLYDKSEMVVSVINKFRDIVKDGYLFTGISNTHIDNGDIRNNNSEYDYSKLNRFYLLNDKYILGFPDNDRRLKETSLTLIEYTYDKKEDKYYLLSDGILHILDHYQFILDHFNMDERDLNKFIGERSPSIYYELSADKYGKHIYFESRGNSPFLDQTQNYYFVFGDNTSGFEIDINGIATDGNNDVNDSMNNIVKNEMDKYLKHGPVMKLENGYVLDNTYFEEFEDMKIYINDKEQELLNKKNESLDDIDISKWWYYER